MLLNLSVRMKGEGGVRRAWKKISRKKIFTHQLTPTLFLSACSEADGVFEEKHDIF